MHTDNQSISLTFGVTAGQDLYDVVTLHQLDGPSVTLYQENGMSVPLVYAGISTSSKKLLVKKVITELSPYKFGDRVTILFEDPAFDPLVLENIINGSDAQEIDAKFLF